MGYTIQVPYHSAYTHLPMYIKCDPINMIDDMNKFSFWHLDLVQKTQDQNATYAQFSISVNSTFLFSDEIYFK